MNSRFKNRLILKVCIVIYISKNKTSQIVAFIVCYLNLNNKKCIYGPRNSNKIFQLDNDSVKFMILFFQTKSKSNDLKILTATKN